MQPAISHRAPGKAFVLVAAMLTALLALLTAWSPVSLAQDATPGGEATPGGAAPEVGPGAIATPALTPGDGMALVNIVHASAALGPIDIYVDGMIAAEGVEFGAVTDFLEVSEDEHEIITVGADGDTSVPAFRTTFDPDAGSSYILVIAGSVDDLQAKSWEMLLDEVSEDQSRVRVINAGHSLNPVNVSLVGGDVLFENVSYFEASDHADVTSGDIELEVRDAESDSPLATLPTFSTGPNTVVEVIVTVDEQGDPYEILVSARGGAEDNGE